MRTTTRTKRSELRVGATFKRWIAFAALSAAAAAACGGCAYFAPSVPLERSEPERWYSSDLPVGEGFTIDKQMSRVHERGTRELHLVYRRENYIDTEQTETFIKDSFVAKGWALKFMYGLEPRKFIFWKGDEECRVTLDRDFRHAYVWFVVEVEPKDFDAGNKEVLASTKKPEKSE